MRRCVKNPLLPFVMIVAGFTLVAVSQMTAQTLTLLHSFVGGTEGAGPQDPLILSGNTLYGTTVGGGTSGLGTLFKINTDGSSFATLHSFSGSDGSYPEAALNLSGTTLYGTTYSGGSFGQGTMFAININGTGFTNLYHFTGGGDGANPQGPLVLLSNQLYGTTYGGGIFGRGTVFKVNIDGMGFTNLHSFTRTNGDGAYPSGLVSSGNVLYGTTQYGTGTVFKVNIDGTGFTNLHTFTGGSAGSVPSGGLCVISNTLYGAAGDGTWGTGTLFALNTDGTDFTILHPFGQILGADLAPPFNLENYDGGNPNNLFVSGNKLYGTTSTLGGWGIGTVFELGTDGTGFNVLYTFEYTFPIPWVGPWLTDIDGAAPNGVILSGTTLYGTASRLGNSGNGTVFSISLPSPQLTISRSTTNTILTWPADNYGFSYADYTLQCSTNLASSTWTPILPVPVVVNGHYTVTNAISGQQQFYRLSQ